MPWDAQAAESQLRSLGWLRPAEHVVDVQRAGEGNMNLTLRIRTSERSIILKRAHPYVEKYPHIPAPAERAAVEAQFYRAVAPYAAIARSMPALTGYDAQSHTLLLEDLGDAADFTFLYGGGALASNEVDMLLGYLDALAAVPVHSGDFANRAMRELNHEHIFRFPLAPDNGLQLDGITPGLESLARKLQSDIAYMRAVAELGALYLADGAALVHGDYFPGSWLRTRSGIKVIDPEFCFAGPPEFDAGVLLGHLYLAMQPQAIIQQVLDYASMMNRSLVERFAGVEMMRRLIGVAQLPLSYRLAEKHNLLHLSRTLVVGE